MQGNLAGIALNINESLCMCNGFEEEVVWPKPDLPDPPCYGLACD